MKNSKILGSSIVYKFNLKEEISEIRDEIICQSLKERHNADYNFQIFTEYNDYLYEIFIKKCRDLFNFSLRHKNSRIWCLFNDKDYISGAHAWHNHIINSTITGVLYLKTLEGCGICYCEDYEKEQLNYSPKEYKNYVNGRQIKYFEPVDYDLIIFPNFMMHTPFFPKDISTVFSENKTRISLNLELRCIESSIDIFSKKTHCYL